LSIFDEDTSYQADSLSDESGKISSSTSIESTTERATTNGNSLQKSKTVLIPLTLPHFYPNVPIPKEISTSSKKKTKKKKSKTKQLLLDALTNSKKEFTSRSKGRQTNQLKKSKKFSRMSKRQRKEIEFDRTIDLTQFIPKEGHKERFNSQKTVNIENSSQEINIPDIQPTIRSSIPILTESDQFPFTTLSEWLIWHSNFPELAFVREAYDLDAVPLDSDEVYWISVMNEPEFFNSNWKMAGSIIHDLNLAKKQGPPSGTPDFDMDLVLTEGFSTLFTDIYLILTKMPNGLKNYRYPVLQLALKGLLLLDLVYLDQDIWFAKESEEELHIRIKNLDEFVEQQEEELDYENNVKILMEASVWQKGIVCFDLLITKSIYLSTFSQTHLPETVKISTLNKNNFQQIMLSSLNQVRFLDELRVNSLSALLTV
jgi:hypothetical protein